VGGVLLIGHLSEWLHPLPISNPHQISQRKTIDPATAPVVSATEKQRSRAGGWECRPKFRSGAEAANGLFLQDRQSLDFAELVREMVLWAGYGPWWAGMGLEAVGGAWLGCSGRHRQVK